MVLTISIIESDLQIDGLRESSAKWIDYDKDGG